MINPYAFFDCLATGKYLQHQLGDVNRTEIHMFAYLSCLLFLYQGNPVSMWNYQFATTHYGSPFSSELEDSIDFAKSVGFLSASDKQQEEPDYLQISKLGMHEFNKLKELRSNLLRHKCIDAACATLLSVPIGSIRTSLNQEPHLKSALRLQDSRMLLQDQGPHLESLYEQFKVISQSIGIDPENLVIPSVIWLTFLFQLFQKD